MNRITPLWRPDAAPKIASARRVAAGLGLAFSLVLLVASPRASATVDTAQLLSQADSLRSSDPKAFLGLLDTLDKASAGMTPTQTRHLRLLHAYSEIYKGRHDLVVEEAEKLFAETPEPDLKMRAGLMVANSAAITRDFSLGLRYLAKTMALENSVGPELRQTALGVAAVLHNQLGQYALGQYYAERLLDQEPTPRNRCAGHQLQVEALWGLGSWVKDDATVDAAIADCDAQHEAIAANLLRGDLARHWAAQGQAPRSIALLESHLADVEATKYPRLIGEIHGLLAEYKLMVGDINGAEQNAHSALAKGAKDAYSLPLVTAHKVLYEVELRRGNLPAALGEYRAYAEADKARLDEIKAREFAFQLSRNELQQKNQAIQLLSKQNEVLKLQQEVTRQSARSSQLLLGLLAFLVVSLVYWGVKIKRTQKRFQHLAQVDNLTGICNRAHLRQQAEEAIVQCRTRGWPVGMLVFDLDNFKGVNDRYGHAGGDWILEQVAQACTGVCRGGELFGRLGGEEFGIVLPDRDLDATERVAEACRAALATIDTSGLGESFTVTASFGCTVTMLSGYDYERLLGHADEAMYAAKHGGRNCIRRYGDAPIRGKAAPVLVRA
jgi:diguanylate cyclase (GGDEF)-like protein